MTRLYNLVPVTGTKPIKPRPTDHFQAQFTALKDQVSPHFLFNSLSVLSSLVRKDPDLSERFIDHLARVYRYLLEHKEDECVSLTDELAFARSYAFVLEVRFGQKLRVCFPDKLPPSNRLMLPFTLQLLIENAIRHNRMSNAEPLTISISVQENDFVLSDGTVEGECMPNPLKGAFRDSDRIKSPSGDLGVKSWRANPACYLLVTNNLQIRTQPEGTRRRGLGSVQARYEASLKQSITVNVTKNAFTVHIPLTIEEDLR